MAKLKKELEIYMLPNELLEKVFSYLDGQSFSRAERVCTRWNTVAQNMQRSVLFWKRLCLRSISPAIVEELLGYRSIPNVSDGKCNPVADIEDKMVDWKALYKTWFRGRMISSWPYKTKSLEVGDISPVTCVKLSGTWIITGHRNGDICAWNHIGAEINSVTSKHLKMVTDMALVDLLHVGPYGSNEYPYFHHHIVSVSSDYTIQVSSLQDFGTDCDNHSIFHHNNGLEAVRVFNDLLAVSCTGHDVSVLQMVLSKDYILSLQFLRKIRGPAELLQVFNFWHNEVVCLCMNGKLKTYSFTSEEWTTRKSNYMLLNSKFKKGHHIYNLKPVAKAFMFRDQIMVFLTVSGKMMISIDYENFHFYHLMQSIRTTVVSMALNGSILALGTEYGQLLLYHVPSQENLLKLDLSSPVWSETLSEVSIIGIDISDNGEAPIITACTSECAYTINWHLPNNHA